MIHVLASMHYENHLLDRYLEKLSDTQQRQLTYALNYELSQMVEVDNSGFIIGVHLKNIPNIKIIESVGAWTLGRLKK